MVNSWEYQNEENSYENKDYQYITFFKAKSEELEERKIKKKVKN